MPKYFDTDIHPITQGLGITREQFARLIGVTQATVSNWIYGRRIPSLVHRAAIERMRIAVENNDTARMTALRALALVNDEHSYAIVQTTLAVLFHQS